MNILRASHLSFALGHVKLLDNVEFLLDENEKVGLIGRNGMGKSSLLKILARIITPDEGTIDKNSSIKEVYLAQESIFDDNKTVEDILGDALGEDYILLKDYGQLSQVIHVLSHQDNQSSSDSSNLLKNIDTDAINALVNRHRKDNEPEFSITTYLSNTSNSANLSENSLVTLLSEKLAQIHDKLDQVSAWDLNYKIDIYLQKLNYPRGTLASTLSGGQKKKLALSCAFIQEPTLLLLDEPTNHLDIDAINWLEKELKEYNRTLVFISHDRQFLDNIAMRIDELDRGHLYSYPGNFSRYQELRQKQLEEEEVHNRKFDKFHAQEEAWIRRGIEARRTRDEGRVKRLKELRKIRSERQELQGNIKAFASEAEKSGKLVAQLENVSFTYPNGPEIIHDFSITIQRGDRIGLIGPNGIGKTTFIKLILGELEPTSGKLIHGTKQEVIYFDQMRSQLELEKTVFDTIAEGNDYVDIGNRRTHVMGYLSDFLFSRERALSPVKSLSGGERNRLLLAKLFTKPSNIIVLDEPTNDLDIDTQEILEEILTNYQGTVFLVSHDRYFLDSIVTETVVFKENGVLQYYIGGYEDYIVTQKREDDIQQDKRALEEKKSSSGLSKSSSSPSSSSTNSNQSANTNTSSSTSEEKNTWRTKELKLSYKEERELESLPSEIEKCEEEIESLNQVLMDGSIYKEDPQKAVEINKNVQDLNEKLNGLIERWEELELKKEACKQRKK